MLAIVVDVVIAVLLLAGSLLSLLAAIGLHRFPDLFSRMHATSKPATLGLALVAIGAGLSLVGAGAAKLLLVVVLQFLTTPVAAHMVGRVAYRSGSPLSDRTVIDELGRDANIEVYGPSD